MGGTTWRGFFAIHPCVPSLAKQTLSPVAVRARRKFLRMFPGGFRDQTYFDWERGYKLMAHQQWLESLNQKEFRSLLLSRQYVEIAARAVRIESRTNLLFSFEKMALRDATKESHGARLFAQGLYRFLHGAGKPDRKFERWCKVVAELPRKQTRVLTWPVVTVFGFIARPDIHIFFKPKVTRLAAQVYGVDLPYTSRPSWPVYEKLLEFAGQIRRDVKDLGPRDLIDIQSFLWVLGSEGYAE
jgi:hypothetical protein